MKKKKEATATKWLTASEVGKPTLLLDRIFAGELDSWVQEALCTLTPREEKVLQLLFGLSGNESISALQVAKHFACSRQRIYQIRNRAFRKLRHPSRRRLLLGCNPPTLPVTRFLCSTCRSTFSDRFLDTILLEKSIEDLELSVRSYNCLTNMGVKTVAQLLQKTPEGLLRVKYFGRKSLMEIREVLLTLFWQREWSDPLPYFLWDQTMLENIKQTVNYKGELQKA